MIDKVLQVLDNFVLAKYLHQAIKVTLLDRSRLKTLVDCLVLNVLVVSVEELVDGRSQDQLLYNDVLLVDQCRS